MALETDLNVNPYFDDYDETKNFNRVLFKPAVPLQARELTQLQTILQAQIERFGQYQFKEGSIIKGCNFYYDAKVKYVKVNDKDTSGLDVNVGLYGEGDYIRNSANLVARIVSTASGLETQNPGLNSLFFHYLNIGTDDSTTYSAGEQIDVFPASTGIANIVFSSANGDFSNSDTITVSTEDNGSGFDGSVVTTDGGTTLFAITVTSNGSGYTVDDYPVASITHANGSTANVQLTVNLNKTSTLTIANSQFESDSGNTQFNTVGNSFLMTVNDGIIFQKGHFQRFEEQNIIVTKYTSSPDEVSVGIETAEAIINSSVDTSLLDNASGFNNENAPGADRLRLTPTLVVNTTSDAQSSNNFLSIVSFQGGRPIQLNQKAVLNRLGDQIARRTYEESGDYVVDPFAIGTEEISGNTTHINAQIGAGVAYVKGYRVETNNTTRLPIKKATVSANVTSQEVALTYGNYVEVDNVIGQFGHETNDMVLLTDATFNAHNSANASDPAVSNTSVAYDGTTGSVVGTARVRNIECQDNNNNNFDSIYNLYLYDIEMKKGKSFSKHVNSIVHYSGSDYSAAGAETNITKIGVADIEAATAKLKDSFAEGQLFNLGQSGIKSVGNNASYVYKSKVSNTISTAGEITLTVTGNEQFNYGDGTLTNTQEKEIIILPQQNANATTNVTSTAATSNATTTVVTGIGDTSSVYVGDLYYLANTTVTNGPFQIRKVANSDAVVVDSAPGSMSAMNMMQTYQKNYPLSLNDRSDANVVVSSSSTTMTISTNIGINGTTPVDVLVNVKDTAANAVLKSYVTTEVGIDTSNNTGGTSGPWSLGVVDGHALVSVYQGTGGGYDSFTTDVTDQFEINNGQTDSIYGLSKLRTKPGSTISLSSGDQLAVTFRHFKKGSGTGFFNFNSYPIDDENTANTSAVTTQQIPMFVSPKTGREVDLRNHLDFRPQLSNTAVIEGTLDGSFTINPSATSTLDDVSKIGAPDTSWSGSFEYYLPRKDRIIVESSGLFVVEGVPSVNPKLPPLPENAMQLASLDVPVYPSLAQPTARADRRPDYGVIIKATQLKRYTMEDIRSIDDRVTNLEYYSSLNFLEKFTTDAVIPGRTDPTTNRFKNGFIVDNFASFTTGNPLDTEFKAGFDAARDLLVSKFENYSIKMRFKSGTNISRSNDLILPRYFNRSIIIQQRATRQRRVTSALWAYNGTVRLFPDYLAGVDNKKSPESAVQINIDNASSTLALIDELNKIAPQQFTSSEVIQDNTNTRVVSSTPTDTQVTNQVEIVRSQRIRQTTTTLSARARTTTRKVGDFVTDISFQPYIPGTEIRFVATGLRPGMRHYVYFDGKDQTSNCRPASVSNPFDAVATERRLSSSRARRMIRSRGAFGDSLTANSSGGISGIYRIPSNTFFAGEREFVVSDASDIGLLGDSVSEATAKFNCYNFTVNKGDVITSTRSALPRASQRQTTITQRTRNVEQVITPLPPAEVTVIENHIEVPNPVPVPVPVPGPERPTPVPNPIPVPNPVPVPVPVPGPTIPGPPVTVLVPGPPITIPIPTVPPIAPPPQPPDTWTDGQRERRFRDEDDPLAQSFLIDSQQFNGYKDGYITAVDIYFAGKDARRGCTVEIRSTENGVPASKVLPFSRTHLNANEITASTNGATKTTFTFTSPVMVEAGREYVVVILPDGNSPEYKVWTAKAGQKDVRTNIVNNQDWGQGTMFLSTNNRTWTEYVDEDLKFTLYAAVFASQRATVLTENEDYEFFQSNTTNINGNFTVGEEVFKLAANVAGDIVINKGNSTIRSTTSGGSDFSAVTGLSAGSKIVLTGNSSTFDVVEVASVANSSTITLRGAPSFTDSTGNFMFTPVAEFVQIDANTKTIQCNDSNATNSTFLFANGDTIIGVDSVANAVINQVVDTNISYLEPRLYRNVPEGTMHNAHIKGRLSDDTGDSSYELLITNDRFYSDSAIKVMSKSNEIVNNSGNKSLNILQTLTSEDNFIGASIDLQSQECLIYENIINNVLTNEYITDQGSASAKYVSRTIELAEGLDAEDIKVYVNAYKPAGTDVKVYAKVLNSEDPTPFKDTRWSLLQSTGANATKISSAKDRGDVIEYTYEFGNAPEATSINGTVTVVNGNTTLTGTGTAFTSDLEVGDLIKINLLNNDTNYFASMVTAVNSDTEIVVGDEPDFDDPQGTAIQKVTEEYKNQVFRDPKAPSAFEATYYNQNDMKYIGYKYLAIKIVLTATSTALNPYVQDYRAIAVSL